MFIRIQFCIPLRKFNLTIYSRLKSYSLSMTALFSFWEDCGNISNPNAAAWANNASHACRVSRNSRASFIQSCFKRKNKYKNKDSTTLKLWTTPTKEMTQNHTLETFADSPFKRLRYRIAWAISPLSTHPLAKPIAS